jgi:hypothetical protein
MARQFVELGVASDTNPSWGLRQDEFIVQLRGRQGIKKYREMAENDPIIGAILTAQTMMLRSIEWRVEEGSETAVEFVRSVMHGMDDKSWEEFVADVLTMLPYGFSLFEMVPRRDSDGLVRMKKLASRAAWTIDRFETTETGDIKGVWQVASQKNVYIPYNRLLHFRTTSAANEPSGRSVLRSAYTSWHAANNIKYFEGVGIERELNGLPIWSIPGEWFSSDAPDWQKNFISEAKRIGRDVKRNEQGFIAVPSDLWAEDDGKLTNSPMVKFDLIASKGTRDIDTGKVITRYQQEMAMSCMADFVMLGMNDRGSFALSKSKADLFLKALEGYADTISAQLNRKLLPYLWELNGMNKDDMPKIVRGRIAPVDLDELGTFIQRLALSGVDLFPDDRLDKHLRDVAGLPEGDPDRPRPNAMAQEAEGNDPTLA